MLVRGISLLGTLLLARLLSPSDFGIYAFAWFWVVVVLAIGDGGVGASLIQQKDEPTPRTMATVWAVQQAVGVSGAVLVWVVAPAASLLLPERASDAPDFVRALALTLPVVTLRSLPTALLERELRFGPLAAGEVAGQIGFYSVTAVMALGGFGAWSFIAGAMAHAASQTAVILVAWGKRPPLGFHADELRRLLSFGLPLQAAVLLTWLRDAIVPWAGALVAGVAVAGYLQLAWRIGQLVSSAEEVISRVAFPTFSRLAGDVPGMQRAIAVAARVTLLVSGPLELWTVASAPVLVPLLFGEQWSPIVPTLQLICIGSLTRFPIRVVRQALFAQGYTARGLIVAAFALVSLVVLAVPLLGIAGLVGAGWGFLGASIVALVVAHVVAGERASLPLLDLARIACESAVAGFAAALVLARLDGVAGLVASALAAAGVALVAAATLERADLRLLRSLLTRAA